MKQFFSNKFFENYDSENIFGKRIIWYLLLRIIKPKIIIESGVFHGLGSGLLAYGIYKNKEDDFHYSAELIGINIKLKPFLLNQSTIIENEISLHEIDSLEFLKKFKKKDKIMYISDASHDPIF